MTDTPADSLIAALAGNWWALLLRGVLAVLFGLVALFLPGLTLWALVLLFGAYAFVDGLGAIGSSYSASSEGR